MTDTLLEAPGSRAALRDAFMKLYGVTLPYLPPTKVMHWAATVKRLGVDVPTLDGVPTWFFGGHFYGSSSPTPTGAEIAEGLREGAAQGAGAFMIPGVRRGAHDALLAEAGFSSIPWFLECVYERREGFDADLRAQIGGDWYRGVLACVKKAEKFYDIAFYSAEDARQDPTILDTVARLHECNVIKYGHPLNFYSRALLEQLMGSELGDKLLLCIRRDRETGEAVQTYISLLDRARSEMYLLVQGIDQDKVRKGQNLYVDHAYRLLKYGEEAGVRMVNFARGAQDQKRRLGANRFFVLQNWVHHTGADIGPEVARLSQATRGALGIDEALHGAVGGIPLE
jgi:hypothetical protein